LIAQVIAEGADGSRYGLFLPSANGHSDQPEWIKKMPTNIAVECAGPTVSVNCFSKQNK